MTISTLDSHTSILIKERNRKKTRSEIFWTEIVLKRVAKLTSLGRTQDCLKKNDHQNQYLCIIWNFVSSVRSSSVYPCLSHTYIHTIHNQPLFQLFRLARVETLTAVSPNPKLRRESKPLGTRFSTKFCQLRWFPDPSDQNELYHTSSYPKIWDFYKRRKKLWTIPLIKGEIQH